jgi:hypothetical protein
VTSDFSDFLKPGPTVQSDDDAVVGFSRRAIGTETQATEQAVLLYYAVRDQIRYDGYDLDISETGLSARRNLELGIIYPLARCVKKWAPIFSFGTAIPLST